MNCQVKFVLASILTTICVVAYGNNDQSRSRIEELRSGLSAQGDSQRLHSLFLIYEYSYELGETPAELEALYQYLNEAHRQGDIAEESYARVQRMCFFYNNNMVDSLANYYPQTMEYLRRNSKWSHYYYVAQLNIKNELFADRPGQALRYANSLYEEARIHNNNYGKGASSYILGKVKLDGDLHEEAIPYLREAIRLLEREEDPTMLFSAYDELSSALCDGKHYEDALAVLISWEKTLGKYLQKQAEDETFHSVNNAEFYCHCGFANVYSQLRMFPEARASLLKAEEKCKGNTLYENLLYQAKSVYCEEMGDYEAAVSWFEKAFSNDAGSSLKTDYDMTLRYARLLAVSGRVDEAAALYEEALVYAGRIRDMEFAARVEDMGHRMEIDRLNSRTRTEKVVATIVMAALLVVFGVYVFYSRRLRVKNSVLSEQLKEVSRLRTWQLSHIVSSEDEHEQEPQANDKTGGYAANGNGKNKNEEMVWLACRKMVEEKKFRDPSLNRKQLADMLGTNENYLASAIREVNDGQTVGDFINGFRLDYACLLITERPNMTLDAIAHDSGLVTRSTLFRLFLKKFGMSPSQYRSQYMKNQRVV